MQCPVPGTRSHALNDKVEQVGIVRHGINYDAFVNDHYALSCLIQTEREGEREREREGRGGSPRDDSTDQTNKLRGL
jgi:hypothetical protein